jgi:hypothetical protein
MRVSVDDISIIKEETEKIRELQKERGFEYGD